MTLEEAFRQCFRPGGGTVNAPELIRVSERLRAGRQVEDSLHWLRDACSSFPDDAFLRYVYGTYLDQHNRLDDALRVFREGRDADTFGVLDFDFKIGRVHHRSQRPQAALAAYRRSLGSRPRAVTWHNAGLCLEQMDDLEDASAAFERAAELDPAMVEARRAAAMCRVAARHPGWFEDRASSIRPISAIDRRFHFPLTDDSQVLPW